MVLDINLQYSPSHKIVTSLLCRGYLILYILIHSNTYLLKILLYVLYGSLVLPGHQGVRVKIVKVNGSKGQVKSLSDSTGI